MPSYAQDLIPELSPVDCTVLQASHIDKLLSHLQRQKDEFWGISAFFDEDGAVRSFSLATSEKVHIIHGAKSLTRQELARLWLIGSSVLPVGFDIDTLVLSFYRTFNIRLAAVDLNVAHGRQQGDFNPATLIKELYPASIKSASHHDMWTKEKAGQNEKNLCLQAWISLKIVERHPAAVKRTSKIDIMKLSNPELSCLCNLYLQNQLAERLTPNVTHAEFSEYASDNGAFVLKNTRYKTRIRPNPKGHLIFEDSTGQIITGRTRTTEGRTTRGYINGHLSGTLKSIVCIGKEMPSHAEHEQRSLVLNILLGKATLQQSYYIRLLWQLSKRDLRPPAPLSPMTNSELNNSQNIAVASVISTDKITLVHGPPGTGKTTVIASATKVWAQAKEPVWIIAHSNVAVKNIGEKLLKEGIDFKLIVSKEFYKEWHEDIYHELELYILRSDELPQELLPLSRTLGSTKIILCTLSMLSNPLLKHNGMFTLIPMKKLIVDEASQINVFEYLAIFSRFHKTLKKVCFFGDPNQLPPFGQEQISSVKSIFDLEHLSTAALFLNEQYRMPTPIGDFISKEVYQNRLFSHHQVLSGSCVAFIDVSGCENSKRGSFTNVKEIQTILHLVRNYYQDKDYCIITPYDAQRAAIIEALKNDKLPSERVFNVDSFQGNEADYVLISVVRTKNTGFLTSINRINVMLTRCKRGMIIAANREFIDDVARDTLLGKMSAHWSKNYLSARWIPWTEIADKKAALPGGLVPNDE